VSDVRCRACGAAVRIDAQWCSLCFADLRPPAPVRQPVSVPAAAAAAHSQSAPPTPAPVPAVPLPTSPVAAVAAPPVVAPAKAAVWPCPRCSAPVAIALDACPECGAGFLAGASAHANTRLPLVGDVGKMSSAQRVFVGFALTFVLMAAFVLLATIGGHFL
jgi:hypothetical protein